MTRRRTIVKITSEEIRSLMIEVLKQESSVDSDIDGLHSKIFDLAKQKGIQISESNPDSSIYVDYSPQDRGKIQAVLWDLVIEGVIRPGSSNGSSYFFPSFHITDWGRKVIQDEPPAIYDPDSYLERIRQIQSIDEIILTYLEESIKTFRIGCLLSSTVTLGCASEKALVLLIEAYMNAIDDEIIRESFRKSIEVRSIQRKFEEFNKKLKGQILSNTSLPSDIKENLENELLGVFHIIKHYRNDAGHPTGQIITRDEAYANLYVFPTYLRKIYKLINWIKQQHL